MRLGRKGLVLLAGQCDCGIKPMARIDSGIIGQNQKFSGDAVDNLLESLGAASPPGASGEQGISGK